MNFFIFLICQTVLLLSIKSYHVHFYMICDDFCISVTSGGVTTYFSSAATSIKRELSLDINLSNEVSIVIQNYDGRFGISGKIDYYYFFVSTNDINYWTISDSTCRANVIQNAEGNERLSNLAIIRIKNENSFFDRKECTFTYKFSLCKDNKYMINKDTPFILKILLK